MFWQGILIKPYFATFFWEGGYIWHCFCEGLHPNLYYPSESLTLMSFSLKKQLLPADALTLLHVSCLSGQTISWTKRSGIAKGKRYIDMSTVDEERGQGPHWPDLLPSSNLLWDSWTGTDHQGQLHKKTCKRRGSKRKGEVTLQEGIHFVGMIIVYIPMAVNTSSFMHNFRRSVTGHSGLAIFWAQGPEWFWFQQCCSLWLFSSSWEWQMAQLTLNLLGVFTGSPCFVRVRSPGMCHGDRPGTQKCSHPWDNSIKTSWLYCTHISRQ